jgi:predicted dehydrogenase
MTSPIHVAGVGAGYFSAFHYDGWRRNADVHLVGIADRDLEKAKAMAERTGGAPAFETLRAMLDAVAPDLIDIVAPPSAHFELIDEATAAGLPVVCQKPFCASLEEARAAVRLAEERRVLIVVHENFRFQPWYRKIAELIREGAVGGIYQITFRLRPGDGQGPRAYLDRQPYFQTMERFLVHETAIHWIDTFRFLLGEPDWVFADLRQLNPAIKGEDAGFFIYGFGNGRRALFDGNRLVDHPAENRRRTMGECLLEGSDATIRLDGDGRLWRRSFNTNRWDEIIYPLPRENFGGDCVYALQKHVTDHLLTGKPIENEAKHYIRNQEIEEAIYQSAADGCRVAIPARTG